MKQLLLSVVAIGVLWAGHVSASVGKFGVVDSSCNEDPALAVLSLKCIQSFVVLEKHKMRKDRLISFSGMIPIGTPVPDFLRVTKLFPFEEETSRGLLVETVSRSFVLPNGTLRLDDSTLLIWDGKRVTWGTKISWEEKQKPTVSVVME